MDEDIISNAIDKVHHDTLKAVLGWLEKYPVQSVIDTLREEIAKKEPK